MSRFTDELGWAFRLMRRGWEYMPALEFIRAHPGTEEADVARIERAAYIPFGHELLADPRTLERYRTIELDRLLGSDS